jgi:ATP-binding cassette subfamily C protein CydD
LHRRLLTRARAARGFLAATVALELAATAALLAQAGLLAGALAGAARGTGIAALAPGLAGLGLVLACRAAAAAGAQVTALRAAAAVATGLRRELSAHCLALGPAWLAGQQAGEITTLMTRGLDGLDGYFARYLPQCLLAVVVPLAVLVRVLLADWISAVIIAVTLPLIPVFAVLTGAHARARSQRQWQLLGRLGGHFLDVVAGLPTVKAFGRAASQAAAIGQATSAHRAATMATLRVAFLSSLVLELAAALATALVAVEVGLRLLAGQLDYRTALVVLLLTPEAYLPLRSASAQFHASTEGTAAARRAFEILDLPASPAGPSPVLTGPAAARAADLRRDPVALHAVTLARPGRPRPALDQVSLTIWPGDRIAVTGPSGAGKSSLLALLLRFTEPSAGLITAGAAELAAIPAGDWLRQIAWVPQHPRLFPDTVAGNVALGRPGASRRAVESACQASGAAGFIERLPRGYDTPLTERAGQLSSGQRQQLALARALLRDAPLLLLDEPAAHLDPASARGLAGLLEAQPPGVTIVMISHASPVPRWAGRTLVLDDGRLREPAAPAPGQLAAGPDPAAAPRPAAP